MSDEQAQPSEPAPSDTPPAQEPTRPAPAEPIVVEPDPELIGWVERGKQDFETK